MKDICETSRGPSAVIKRNKFVVDCSHLRLGELPEHGCQSIVINVAVGLYSHIQDMDRLILDTLNYRANTNFLYRCTVSQVNDEVVTIKGLLSSPCCPLRHTEQDYLPLGSLDLGEESQKSSSTHLVCSCERGKITHLVSHLSLGTLSSSTNNKIQVRNYFTQGLTC